MMDSKHRKVRGNADSVAAIPVLKVFILIYNTASHAVGRGFVP